MNSTTFDIDSDWEKFCKNDYETEYENEPKLASIDSENDSEDIDLNIDEINQLAIHDGEEGVPKCSDIYISTKTKIAYLSTPINLRDTFWKIKVSPYHTAKECVIKKQMKFNSSSEEELADISEHLKSEGYWEEHIITRIVNPEGRIKFKDIRKISVGLCKKDILSYRTKKKSAFYNCFVVILRLKHNNVFKELHVKVFNTGKLEIPGIQSDDLLKKVLDLLVEVLSPIVDKPLSFIDDKNETVLINSNFNCGFYINREKLYQILKYKYHINSGYDPCSYPGIQCKFYYDTKIKKQTGHQPMDVKQMTSTQSKISFMIFRTGSVLIVGKCNEIVLNEVYQFIKNLLVEEHANISCNEPVRQLSDNTEKKRKIRKKTITVE